MFEFRVLPRLSETDGLGHISNTVLPAWFEEARRDLFRLFNPELSLNDWNLILRKYEVEIENQISHTEEVLIYTGVSRIGNTSFGVHQRVWQGGTPVASAESVIIHFDYASGRATEIPRNYREKLEAHLVDTG